MERLEPAQVDSYLERIGLDPRTIGASDPGAGTLARLQTAHVTHVPFENFAIVGDPFEDGPGPGVSIDIDALYEKIVEREHGGFCFELNGLFTTLLASLGYDVHRAAAMIIPEDGEHTTPANHHVCIVSMDRRYVVDVGMGSPQMRGPTPLDGDLTPRLAADVQWRVIDNDRPRYDRPMHYRIGDGEFQPRYDFDATPRRLSYFEAACDYLAAAPESPFTDNPIARIEVADGWLHLTPEAFTRVIDGERSERSISREEYETVLEREFSMELP